MNTSLKLLKKDKRFAALIKKHGAPELTRGTNLFQALARAIVYQQLSAKHTFPKPEVVLTMPFEKLRSVGLSGQKATYLHDLALKFTDGTIKYKSLHNMSTNEVTAHLTQVKGVGVWTVHMLQIFTLGRLDVLPTGDLGVRKGFQTFYKLKTLPTSKQMEKLAVPWRAHASVASWYMWRLADEAKAAKIKPKK